MTNNRNKVNLDVTYNMGWHNRQQKISFNSCSGLGFIIRGITKGLIGVFQRSDEGVNFMRRGGNIYKNKISH